MKLMPVVKGVAAGAAVGTACWMISKSTRHQRHSLRRDTGRTVRSIMTVLGDLSDMI